VRRHAKTPEPTHLLPTVPHAPVIPRPVTYARAPAAQTPSPPGAGMAVHCSGAWVTSQDNLDRSAVSTPTSRALDTPSSRGSRAVEAIKSTGIAAVAEQTGATVAVEAMTTGPSSAAIGKASQTYLPGSRSRPATDVAVKQADANRSYNHW
jgi:hypothetical protein